MITLQAPQARYRQVADALRNAIKRGEYPPGSALPSQPDLARQYNLNQTSINRAIALLRAEGLVRVEHGRGAFVQEIPTVKRTRRIPRETRREQLRRRDAQGRAGAPHRACRPRHRTRASRRRRASPHQRGGAGRATDPAHVRLRPARPARHLLHPGRDRGRPGHRAARHRPNRPVPAPRGPRIPRGAGSSSRSRHAPRGWRGDVPGAHRGPTRARGDPHRLRQTTICQWRRSSTSSPASNGGCPTSGQRNRGAPWRSCHATRSA